MYWMGATSVCPVSVEPGLYGAGNYRELAAISNLPLRRQAFRGAGLPPALDVDRGAERVFLDEVAPRLDHVAHQLGEDVVGLVDLLDLHLQERAHVGIQRGL